MLIGIKNSWGEYALLPFPAYKRPRLQLNTWINPPSKQKFLDKRKCTFI